MSFKFERYLDNWNGIRFWIEFGLGEFKSTFGPRRFAPAVIPCLLGTGPPKAG